MTADRPNAWIELDFGVLRANLASIRRALAPGAELIQVVKANAYGHGLPAVARHAHAEGVRWFLVARLDEALAVRTILPDAGILLLGAVWPSDLPVLHARQIVPVLVSAEQAAALAMEARRLSLRIPCHVKIDTGMGRFGLDWQTVVGTLGTLRNEGGLDIRGLCMHFASADRHADSFAGVQAGRFAEVEQACRAQGWTGLFRHVSNSAAFMAHPEWHMDGVRLGILTYGYAEPQARAQAQVCTRPFLQWKTRVVQVKRVPAGFPVSYLSTHVTLEPTWLATIDAGYADGLSRLMSNRGQVLVGGRRARMVGRVTMNFTTVDVGPQGGVQAGDEVVLIGAQGQETLWAGELARWCETIPYEILTSIRSQPLA